MTHQGSCRLCGDVGTLEEGHVVPGFVFRWLKKSAATPYLRFGQSPDKRVQDGPKRYWLCSKCEDRFERWEKPFSKTVFEPLRTDSRAAIDYEDWCLKFAVSVSWRVLLFFQEEGRLSHLTGRLPEQCERALEAWRRFLLGVEPNPGAFEQHLFPLSEVVGYRGAEPPTNINRYFLRTVDIDVPCNRSGEAYVYCKIPYAIIYGCIFMERPAEWRDSKLRLRRGVFSPTGRYEMPGGIGAHFQQRAKALAQAEERISKHQLGAIQRAYEKVDPEIVRRSGAVRAAAADLKLFGSRAIPKKPKDS